MVHSIQLHHSNRHRHSPCLHMLITRMHMQDHVGRMPANAESRTTLMVTSLPRKPGANRSGIFAEINAKQHVGKHVIHQSKRLHHERILQSWKMTQMNICQNQTQMSGWSHTNL